ncbi:MAG TPA: aminotransferase class I/II-fold pyridoxal phosphate-dependent enzyme [Flavobacteriaceae bacterium]|nr:aminotransferase class I/II-fold pyridoxal phosphate-dependent enzyme [Flavobacteriaceae bacterium]
MSFNPAKAIEGIHTFGPNYEVNPPISDTSTYAFKKAKDMYDTFEGETEGMFLYSRHTSPSTAYLSEALATMENMPSANVTASGMGAIVPAILQLCGAGDHIIASRTIYGGTYAFLKNFAPRLGIETTFVDITDLPSIEDAIMDNTKLIYCETVSNPLLEVADLPSISKISKKNNLKLFVDNTFSPLSISPQLHGADVVLHSLTKYINGSSDAMGGVLCADEDFINSTKDVNTGASMLMGASMDSFRAASILKNLRTLPIRIQQHSKNAMYLAKKLEEVGIPTLYPGLKSHPGHEVFSKIMNKDFGFGGMLTIDVGSQAKADALMEKMQDDKLGYLAVSLGFYKTLFSAPGASTSSEIPEEEQETMGLSKGLVRISIGLDHDIENTYQRMLTCLKEIEII